MWVAKPPETEENRMYLLDKIENRKETATLKGE